MSSNIRVQRLCGFCGREFTARTSVTQYCGDRCASRAYKQRKRGEKIEESNTQTTATLATPIVQLQYRDFLSVQDVCQLLGISRSTVQRAIARGSIKAVRLGRRIIIKRVDVDGFLS